MTSFGKKLVKGFSYGTCVGFILYCIGAIAKTIIGVNFAMDLAGFAIGLSAATSIAIAEDEKESKQQ